MKTEVTQDKRAQPEETLVVAADATVNGYKIGVDQWTFHHLGHLSGVEILELLLAHGLEGYQFGDARQISRTLDRGEVREVREHAIAHGMYIEGGVPCFNPHQPGPAALEGGDGDLQLGIRRHLEALADVVVESRAVRCVMGKPCNRTLPVPWPQQIADTVSVARQLTPILRDLDLKLAFETHAEATSTELLRMIEAIGSDVVGICLDTGNFPMTLEDPVAAVQRVAPYAIATHLKDGLVVFVEDGLVYQARPSGQGIIPMQAILQELVRANPDLRTLSLEDHDGLFRIRIFDDEFVSTFANQPIREFAHVIRMARECEQCVAGGTLPSLEALEAVPWVEQALPRLEQSARYIRQQVAMLSLTHQRGESVL